MAATSRVWFSVCLLAFAAASATARADNLLVNPDFDLAAGLGGWTAHELADNTYTPCSGTGSCGAFLFTEDECCAQPASGSISATSPLLDFSELLECVTVAENTAYDYGAWLRLTNRPPGIEPGLPGVSVSWFASADCSGSAMSSGPQDGTESLLWTRIGIPSIVAPMGAHSAAFILAIGVSGDAGVMVTAEYDSAFFGPSGTVPVELQAFSVK
jgi:hypothetical protein